MFLQHLCNTVVVEKGHPPPLYLIKPFICTAESAKSIAPDQRAIKVTAKQYVFTVSSFSSVLPQTHM